MSTANASEKDIARQESQIRRVRPASDIVEREDGFHIFMDMPGVEKGDLAIDLNKNEVTVSAPVRYDEAPGQEKGGRRYTHVEFGSGLYTRSFTLADSVDREKITASLNNGVLDLYLPKSEQSKPRRIEISAG